MSSTAAVLVTLIVYKVTLLGLGWWGSRRTHSGEDFFLGGRQLPPLVAAISASASSSSAWTLLGTSGFAYAYGLSAFWLIPACVGGFALNWFVVAPRLRGLARGSGALTLTDVLADDTAANDDGVPRARLVRSLASAVIVVFLGLYVASQFQGAAKTFQETFGLDLTTSLLLGATIVILYTLWGGFWAVSLTDTLQGLVMAGTAIVVPLGALVAVGGPSELWAALPTEAGYRDLFQGLGPMAGLGFAAGLLGIGLGYPGQPHVVNRFMALRGEKREMGQAQWISIAWALVVYSGMLTLGWCGRVLMPGLEDSEVVFISLTGELFPPVVAGVVVAAVLSAIMSTADSQLLVAASAVTHDLGRSEENRVVPRSRWMVLGLASAAVVIALVGPREIFRPVLVAWSALGATFGPPLLARLFRGPLPPSRTLATMLTGLCLAVLGAWLRTVDPAPWSAIWERVVPFGVACIVAFWPRR